MVCNIGHIGNYMIIVLWAGILFENSIVEIDDICIGYNIGCIV
jgi:hypothetical protein